MAGISRSISGIVGNPRPSAGRRARVDISGVSGTNEPTQPTVPQVKTRHRTHPEHPLEHPEHRRKEGDQRPPRRCVSTRPMGSVDEPQCRWQQKRKKITNTQRQKKKQKKIAHRQSDARVDEPLPSKKKNKKTPTTKTTTTKQGPRQQQNGSHPPKKNKKQKQNGRHDRCEIALTGAGHLWRPLNERIIKLDTGRDRG